MNRLFGAAITAIALHASLLALEFKFASPRPALATPPLVIALAPARPIEVPQSPPPEPVPEIPVAPPVVAPPQEQVKPAPRVPKSTPPSKPRAAVQKTRPSTVKPAPVALPEAPAPTIQQAAESHPDADTASAAVSPASSSAETTAPAAQNTADSAMASVVKSAPAAPPPISMARPAYGENPPPPYPPLARRRGYQGVVALEVLVNETGRVADLRLRQSSGFALLDNTALEAVAHWRFHPGKHGDQPVAMWVNVPVQFRLE